MSVVWTIFNKCPDDISMANCSICNKKISRGGKNSREFTTSNLMKHIKHDHYNEFKKINYGRRNLTVNDQSVSVSDE